MRRANGITAHLLEHGQLVTQGIAMNGRSKRTEVVVQAHTLELRAHAVEVEPAVGLKLEGTVAVGHIAGIDEQFDILVSTDNGATWTPHVTESPYLPQYAMRQYDTTANGIKHYTDQMPVALQLNNGTIALAAESSGKISSIFLDASIKKGLSSIDLERKTFFPQP